MKSPLIALGRNLLDNLNICKPIRCIIIFGSSTLNRDPVSEVWRECYYANNCFGNLKLMDLNERHLLCLCFITTALFFDVFAFHIFVIFYKPIHFSNLFFSYLFCLYCFSPKNTTCELFIKGVMIDISI